ncbi:MAG: ethanolamine ammonia-lyase subunit EutC [Pirellulaceae bacterium]
MLPDDPQQPLIRSIRQATHARLALGSVGGAMPAASYLQLREDHALAVDAVHRDSDLIADWGSEFLERFPVIQLASQANSKGEYLKRPDLGRSLSEASLQQLRATRHGNPDLQILIGDGLSSLAVARQVPELLPRLIEEAQQAGWTIGPLYFVRYCRVGVLNDFGKSIDAKVFVLLIGERPGLGSPESLSAYMAYRPEAGHTDADRNLISNIHPLGVGAPQAAQRIFALASQMMQQQASGFRIKEAWVPERLSPSSHRRLS